MPTMPDWINLALIGSVAIVLLIFVWVCVWGVSQIKGVLDILTRHERARMGLEMESFHPSDTDWVSKFNRNFDRIRFVCMGVEIFEHSWSLPGSWNDPNPKRMNGKCLKCGMKMADFFGSDNFKGCVDER